MSSLIIGINYCLFHFKCDHKATAGTGWPESEWHALLVQISEGPGDAEGLQTHSGSGACSQSPHHAAGDPLGQSRGSKLVSICS